MDGFAKLDQVAVQQRVLRLVSPMALGMDIKMSRVLLRGSECSDYSLAGTVLPQAIEQLQVLPSEQSQYYGPLRSVWHLSYSVARYTQNLC
jgi:hypothetical protein